MRHGGCHCGVQDWRALRLAMGLSLTEMARLLCISRRHVAELQRQPHRCPRPLVVVALRSVLMDPEMIGRLASAGFPHPFPYDTRTA